MNKMFLLVIPFAVMCMQSMEVAWKDEETFNMCECTKIAQSLGNTEQDSKEKCKELLIEVLLKRSAKTGEIETITVIGCE